jgi:hypothetical protein
MLDEAFKIDVAIFFVNFSSFTYMFLITSDSVGKLEEGPPLAGASCVGTAEVEAYIYIYIIN